MRGTVAGLLLVARSFNVWQYNSADSSPCPQPRTSPDLLSKYWEVSNPEIWEESYLLFQKTPAKVAGVTMWLPASVTCVGNVYEKASFWEFFFSFLFFLLLFLGGGAFMSCLKGVQQVSSRRTHRRSNTALLSLPARSQTTSCVEGT